ncbi:hypothetical protein RUM44_003324 [Polyplax serrata]|uniref:Enhancer of mRNA-decapping protein 4 n=1 Tax=Polyplax serrata TaxID=468196 RepID=A0ABR1AG49_POLSC
MDSPQQTDRGVTTTKCIPRKLSVHGITQIVKFTGEDDQHTEELTCTRVTLIPSDGKREKCSPNVNLKSVVDYTWEHRIYTGQLLAVHIGGRFIAYGLKAGGSNNGAVRVVNRMTSQRGLIKGMEGLIQDIAFAHIDYQIWLAIVDERGSLFVYMVEEDETTKALSCILVLHVQHDIKPEPGCNHRIIWVPYMPDESDVDSKEYADIAKLLVLTLGCKAELWHVAAVIARYGPGPHKPEDLEEGLLTIEEHTKSIVDATFSPEGSALATVSLDGTIMFFQVYMQQKQTPRCLHSWRPHDGKPLSSIFFLDNHKSHNPESHFWKFMITGAENNTELKVWACVHWTCLQTLRFTPDANTKKTGLFLKAGLDLSARHLLLSDIFNQVIYVLRIYVDPKETTAFICSASEFVIPFSVLSFGIVDAGTRHCKNNTYLLDQDDDDDDPEDEDDDIQEAVGVLMYLVQPKSMQECRIRFIPPLPESDLPLSTIIPDSLVTEQTPKKDVETLLPEDEMYNNSNKSYKSSIPLNLMTPEEFSTSPAKKEVEEFQSKEDVSEQDVFSSFPRDVHVSGGSSPSREVQEILSLQSNNSDREVEDLINLQPPQIPFYSGGRVPEIDVTTKNNEMDGLKSSVQSNNGWPRLLTMKCREGSADAGASQENCDTNGEVLPETTSWKPSQKIEITLSTILASVQQQEAQIRELRQEVSMLRSRQSESVVASLCKSALDQQSLILEEQLAIRESKERDRHEKLISVMTQAVNNLVTTKFEEIMSNEIKDIILPAMLNDMDQIKRQLHIEMAQKLTATDHLLKENISKLVNSKSVMEVLSLSLLTTIRPSVTEICKEVFTQIVIPRCEKALDRIFVQVHETFTQGTREYILQIQKELEKMRQQIIKGSELLVEYQTINRETRDKFATSFHHDLQINVQKTLTNIQDNINRKLSEIVKDCISKEFQSQKSVIQEGVLTSMRSRAVTPASHIVDQIQIMQAQITQLVALGQVNAAFQQALSASDLNLVVFLCDRLNPEQLFRQSPCPLQQAVLLSLIQQLSADMTNHTDLKYRYLEEAIMNLDSNNAMTKEHLPGVLSTLQKQLNSFLTSNPGPKYARKIKMLLMMTQSLLPGTK